jgi:phosphohistidine phosphatase
MRLLLIRHAVAVPRGTPGIPDDERPLTPEGAKKFRAAAKGLATLVDPPDALLTSPLPRASRTAEIAAEAWGGVSVKMEPALAGDRFDRVFGAVSKHPGATLVALVGHEPHLSGFLAQLLGAQGGAPLTFRKGGAALVELEPSHARTGALLWFLTPKILRRLG